MEYMRYQVFELGGGNRMYEYKFIEVPLKGSFRAKTGDTFEECKNIINEEAQNGWRLKQVIIPANEKLGVLSAYCYQIIFEKEVK